jgi:hypothetical protein
MSAVMENESTTIEPGAPVVATRADGPPAPEKTKTRQMSFSVLEDGTIRAEFGEGVEPLTLNPTEVPETLQAAAMTEGLISRSRGYTSKLTEENRTPEKLREAIEKAFANLRAGVWKIERAPGEAEFSIEVEAAHLFRQMRAKAKGENYTGSIQDAADNFAQLSDDQKKTLKALPRYQLALAEVKAQRQAAKAAKLAAKLSEGGDEDAF